MSNEGLDRMEVRKARQVSVETLGYYYGEQMEGSSLEGLN